MALWPLWLCKLGVRMDLGYGMVMVWIAFYGSIVRQHCTPALSLEYTSKLWTQS